MIAVSGWFFSFGLQTTLFPGVINYTLNESPDRLGIAQAALTAPMLFLLPLAGVGRVVASARLAPPQFPHSLLWTETLS